jgi:N-acetyl-gamma-glutamyl-phosphate reductase
LNHCSSSVAVIGATGYAGFELTRILLHHPHVHSASFFVRESGEKLSSVAELHPGLRGLAGARCLPFSVGAVCASGPSTVFFCTPHEVSLKLVPQLLAAAPDLRIVDLSGAFRFRQPETFAAWYRLQPPPADILSIAIYGLPELYPAQLRAARLVANPGCYATSVILALHPLLEAGWVNREHGIVCDCKSGVSGAGKKPKPETHFVEVAGNFRAYGAFTHRHTPELAEHLGLSTREFFFTAHLLPIERGILSTVYVWLNPPRRAAEIESLYQASYPSGGMVRTWPAGSLPELRHVVRTNYCDIGFALDESGERMVVVSCLDNLGKGAAGQAVQNFNGMMGCAETAGLL